MTYSDADLAAILHARLASFTDGAELVHWAGILEHLSEILLENLDQLVDSTYEGSVDTSPPRT